MASQKVDFATKCQQIATALAANIYAAKDVDSVYFDRGYNSGGADPIIDADIVGLEITATELGAFITLTQQLANFADNAAVTQGDYDATLNQIRIDF